VDPDSNAGEYKMSLSKKIKKFHDFKSWMLFLEHWKPLLEPGCLLRSASAIMKKQEQHFSSSINVNYGTYGTFFSNCEFFNYWTSQNEFRKKFWDRILLIRICNTDSYGFIVIPRTYYLES
jgi:hypothetical protein